MKKVAFIVSMLFVVFSTTAQDYTSVSRIFLATEGQSDKEVIFVMSDEFSDGVDSDDTPAVSAGIYVFYNNEKWSVWASNKYSKNLKLGFVAAGTSTTYKLKFDNAQFEGEKFKILDTGTNPAIEIEVDGTNGDYEFDITADQIGKVINDRFIINKGFDPDEGELEICFNEKGDNVLEIKNNPFDAQILIFKDGADTLTVYPVQTPQKINLSSLDAGKYIVQMANGSRKFVIVKQ